MTQKEKYNLWHYYSRTLDNYVPDLGYPSGRRVVFVEKCDDMFDLSEFKSFGPIPIDIKAINRTLQYVKASVAVYSLGKLLQTNEVMPHFSYDKTMITVTTHEPTKFMPETIDGIPIFYVDKHIPHPPFEKKNGKAMTYSTFEEFFKLETMRERIKVLFK